MGAILKRLFGSSDRWSIGIYSGNSPFHLDAPKGFKNPVLTARDVTDRKAEFVADPFMIKEQGVWYMFFEVLDFCSSKGDIGLAISRDGLSWQYKQIVLSEPFHLSYPYIFNWENEFYMVPESCGNKSIRLYKSVGFPYKWEFIGDLLTGADFVDSSIFHYSDTWWLFTCPTVNNDVLKLFYADNLKGPWFEHPANPIINGNAHIARCGGRVLVWGDRVIRYAQDEKPLYGKQLHAFEVSKLTVVNYEEREYLANPVLTASGKGWNKDGMHTVDPYILSDSQWIACVDGNTKYPWIFHILYKFILDPKKIIKRILSFYSDVLKQKK